MGNLADYQARVDEAVTQQTPEGEDVYWNPFVMLGCLTEELGEVARELNHLHGPKKRKPEEPKGNLAAELGDMLFTLICLANSQRIDLDDPLKNAIAKCTSRDLDRFRRKS